MLVPRKDRLAIFAHLFREGAVACPKNVTATHRQINVPNIYVMKLMLSLKSRNYVTETFNWQWFYYTLTDAGVEYLRNYLHLPAETVPNTHKKVERVAPPPSFGGERQSFGAGRGRAGRDGAFAGRREGAGRDFQARGPQRGGPRRAAPARAAGATEQ